MNFKSRQQRRFYERRAKKQGLTVAEYMKAEAAKPAIIHANKVRGCPTQYRTPHLGCEGAMALMVCLAQRKQSGPS